MLTGLLSGSSEKQIARSLQISINTVHCYVTAIYRLYDVQSRYELIAGLASPAMLQVMLDEAESRIGARAFPAYGDGAGHIRQERD